MNRSLAVALLALLFSACGFHLRGPEPLPFRTIYVGARTIRNCAPH